MIIFRCQPPNFRLSYHKKCSAFRGALPRSPPPGTPGLGALCPQTRCPWWALPPDPVSLVGSAPRPPLGTPPPDRPQAPAASPSQKSWIRHCCQLCLSPKQWSIKLFLHVRQWWEYSQNLSASGWTDAGSRSEWSNESAATVCGVAAWWYGTH